MTQSKQGFSLVEAMMVTLLVMIGSSVAIIQMRNSLEVLDADAACDLVVSQVRYARQIAVDQRRNVEIEFFDDNRIRITRDDGGGASTVMSEETLPGSVTFGIPGGAPDTPEAYGNTAAVFFNGETSGTFLGDGIFVSATNVVLNGTVFTMGGDNGSARAVTLAGASGRLRTYRISGGAWVER
jgi:Tfp pilus assembly protein FimT